MRNWFNRGKLWLISSALGGSVFALEGCDPNVRDTVLSGVENAATTITSTVIQAFFESVIAPDDDSTITTVKAVIEELPQYFA